MSTVAPPTTPASHFPTISTTELPPKESAIFLNSTFFTRNGPGARLPSVTDIRRRSTIDDPDAHDVGYGFRPVRYEEIGLIVKFGRAPFVTVAEGQCLWALRQALLEVPVPEVYGWTHDGGQVFIFMELVQGVTLEQQWGLLDQANRIGICQQLRTLLSKLRKLRHVQGEFFLGHINCEPLGDIIFTNEVRPPAGPFSSVSEFHDWISLLIRTGKEIHWPGKTAPEIPDPYREGLPDDAAVVFTHADLHPSNIMVSREISSCKVVALIDWRQSGWYPDYWEYCKAMFTAEVGGEWMEEYIPRFLDEHNCIDTWDSWYAQAIGY